MARSSAMDGKNLLVVACVLEARNLSLPQSCCLVVEGKLGGESLSSDPVTPAGSGVLEVNTELAWEMTRRTLQQHKLQRTPVKLQCHAVDTRTGAKQMMGYVLLDLRSAQQNVHQPQSNWLGLLNSRGGTPRPELCVSLTVEAETASLQALEVAQPDSATFSLVLALDSSGSYYTLGPAHLQQRMLTLSLTLQNPTNIPHVHALGQPMAGSPWYFYYNLLGNDITSEPFRLGSFRPERASVRVKSTRELLGTLLSAQEDLQIDLCCGEQSLYCGSVSMATLVSSDQLVQTVLLQPKSQQEASMVSLSTVEVVMQVVDGLLTTPRPPGPVAQPVEPSFKATAPPPPTGPPQPICLPSLTSQAPPTTARGAATPTSQEISVSTSSSSSSSVKRNLTHSFEEVARADTGSHGDERRQDGPGHAGASPATHGTPTASVPTTMSGLAAVRSTIAAPPPATTITSTHVAGQTSMPAYQREGPTVDAASDSMHHFRFSIDIRSIHNLGMNPDVQYYLRYCYQFFGCPYPVLVHPPTTVPINTDRSFLQSYCAFDFATLPLRLQQHLAAEPLSVEVWQSCDSQSGRQDQIVGVAKVNLSEVLSAQRLVIGGGDGSTIRQICSVKVPITPPPPAHPGPAHAPPTSCGYLHASLIVEDLGVVRVAGIQGVADGDIGGRGGRQAHRPQPASSEYKAALELEMWKMAEEENFQQALQSKEKAHMSRLAEEWGRREQQRQQILKQKMDHYSELEKSLQSTLRDVQEQQSQLQQQEREMSVERSRLSQELQAAQAKANTLLLQAKTEHEHEVKLERLRAKELERQVSQLTQQVLDLEHKCTTKDAEFDAYRKQLLSQPETTLQAQVNMLQLEKGELERKLSAAVKSKQHYKEQWTKALRELAAVRQKEQAAARERLHRQQEELEMMRAQFLQQETQHSLRSQLEEVKSEVNSLQQQTLAKKHQPPPLTVEGPGQRSGSSRKDSEVARWIEERDILLQTGVYTSADPTIQRLDQRIREALAQQTDREH